MNCFSRVFLPIAAIAALAMFAGPLRADDAIDLKHRWIAGKKYDQTIERTKRDTVTIDGKSIEQSVALTVDISESVRAGEDGKSKQMTLKYERVAMEMSISGQKLGFDSSKPELAEDPLGLSKSIGSLAGKELKASLSDKDEITGLENYDEFFRQLGASPLPGLDMSRMFSKEAVTQMMNSGGLQAAPDHAVKPGDSWPFTTNLELPKVGKIAIQGTYTLKGLADHEGTPCAEITADAKITLDFSGGNAANPAAAMLTRLGVKVQEGSLKGTIWFDPKLGMARDTRMTQEFTMTMKNPMDPNGTLSVPTKQEIHVKLTKVEDLK